MSEAERTEEELGARIASHGPAVGDPGFWVVSTVAIFVAAILATTRVGAIIALVVVAGVAVGRVLRNQGRDVQLALHERGVLYRVGPWRRRVRFDQMRAVRIAKVDVIVGQEVACAIDLADDTTLTLSPHLEGLEAIGRAIEARMTASGAGQDAAGGPTPAAG